MPLALPYVHHQRSRGQLRHQLIEPIEGEDGRGTAIYHTLGATPDPSEALEGMKARLAERIAWARDSPTPEEVAEIEAARSKVEGLARAIVRMRPKDRRELADGSGEPDRWCGLGIAAA